MQMSRDCHNHLKVSFPQGSPGAPGKLTQPSDPQSAQTNKLKTKPTKNSTQKYLQRSRETPNFTRGKEHVGFKLFSPTALLCLHIRHLCALWCDVMWCALAEAQVAIQEMVRPGGPLWLATGNQRRPRHHLLRAGTHTPTAEQRWLGRCKAWLFSTQQTH